MVKGTLWFTWVVLFPFFLTGQSFAGFQVVCVCLFVCFDVSVNYSSVVEDKTKCKLHGLHGIHFFFNLLLLSTT